MVINSDGSLINIKDKLSSNVQKKKTEKVTDSKPQKGISANNNDKELKKFADIIEIKRENLLAAGNYNNIKNESEAYKILEDLKNRLEQESVNSSIDIHGKVDPDKVLKFYPFD